MHVGITQGTYVCMLGIEQGVYTAEPTQKRDKVQSDHPDQENWKHLEGDKLNSKSWINLPWIVSHSTLHNSLCRS
jgi:hypothetical protein